MVMVCGMVIHWDMATLMVIIIMAKDITEGTVIQISIMDIILMKRN